ncbi:hypothetical protein IWZ03DRAFT_360034 [Phyllosticta citriasiana]|uniref:Secreted protein n=1 Tax=Phyllosticta citriasiana TaxID=595635 RepID=A0ABR1KJL0_9PEZI
MHLLCLLRLLHGLVRQRLSTSAPALAPVHVLALGAATTTVLSAVVCEARRDGGRRWTMRWELPELWSVAVGSATIPNARQICDVAAWLAWANKHNATTVETTSRPQGRVIRSDMRAPARSGGHVGCDESAGSGFGAGFVERRLASAPERAWASRVQPLESSAQRAAFCFSPKCERRVAYGVWKGLCQNTVAESSLGLRQRMRDGLQLERDEGADRLGRREGRAGFEVLEQRESSPASKRHCGITRQRLLSNGDGYKLAGRMAPIMSRRRQRFLAGRNPSLG